jgi:hypothetical protein
MAPSHVSERAESRYRLLLIPDLRRLRQKLLASPLLLMVIVYARAYLRPVGAAMDKPTTDVDAI